jgi:hypothetical protein
MNNNMEQLEKKKCEEATCLGDMFAAVCSGKKRSQQQATARGASRVAPLFVAFIEEFVDFLASQTRGLHQDGEKDTRPLSHFGPLAALLFTDRRRPLLIHLPTQQADGRS